MSEPAKVVRALWERFQARDWDAAAELIAEDAVFDWPQTRERIRGRANVIAVNRNYPEGWTIRVLRILEEADTAASEVAVDHGTFYAASFYEVRGGRIARATEYWVDPPTEDPPAWRAQWVERY